MPGPLELLLGLAPGLAWTVHVARKDDWEREPWRVVLAVFALGALAAFLIAVQRPRIEAFWPALDGVPGRVVDAFLVTALSEELAKLAAVALGALWLAEWDEPMDGLVYGAAAGLGFAAVENAYFLSTEGFEVAVFGRVFTAMLAHACFTASGALLLGLARLRAWRSTVTLTLLGFAAAVVPHGLYDLLLFGSRGEGLVALLALLPAVLGVFALELRWARALSPDYHPRDAVA